jgi:hypothetical protein
MRGGKDITSGRRKPRNHIWRVERRFPYTFVVIIVTSRLRRAGGCRMLFRVRGTNKDTHALMVLDIEAVSRPAAEYKAQSRGMIVTSMEEITAADAAGRPTSLHRGEGSAPGAAPESGGMRNLIVFVAVLVAVALIGFFTLPMVLQQHVAPTPATTQATLAPAP